MRDGIDAAFKHSGIQQYLRRAGLIHRFEEGDPDDIRARRTLAREQTGMETPLRSAGAYSPPKNPWPRENDPPPEDDMKVDPMMPVGPTSKTWNPKADQNCPRQSGGGEEWTHSSASSSQWKPRLRTEKYISSAAGDTSEASTALQHLGSIDESEGDAVRDWHARTRRQ